MRISERSCVYVGKKYLSIFWSIYCGISKYRPLCIRPRQSSCVHSSFIHRKGRGCSHWRIIFWCHDNIHRRKIRINRPITRSKGKTITHRTSSIMNVLKQPRRSIDNREFSMTHVTNNCVGQRILVHICSRKCPNKGSRFRNSNCFVSCFRCIIDSPPRKGKCSRVHTTTTVL